MTLEHKNLPSSFMSSQFRINRFPQKNPICFLHLCKTKGYWRWRVLHTMGKAWLHWQAEHLSAMKNIATYRNWPNAPREDAIVYEWGSQKYYRPENIRHEFIIIYAIVSMVNLSAFSVYKYSLSPWVKFCNIVWYSLFWQMRHHIWWAFMAMNWMMMPV